MPPLLVAVALVGGCAAERVSGLRHESSMATQVDTHAIPGCSFRIDAIEDKRDSTGLGHLGRTLIDGEGFMRWFSNGMTAVPGQRSDASPDRSIRVTVMKAYVQGIGTLKSANLVVRVSSADAQTPSRLYRGVDASTNWWNSESEVQTAFDNALADLAAKIGADLQNACPRT